MRPLRRLLTPLALVALAAPALALTLSPQRARATEIDAAGHLQSANAGALLVGFEDAYELVQLQANTFRWSGNPYNPTFERRRVLDSTVFAGRTVPAALAPQGRSALRVGAPVGDGQVAGIELPAAPLLAKLGTKKLAVTVWVRGEGDLPQLALVYARADRTDGFVRVIGQRTGRETSDGWAEITSGEVDAEVWGVPLARIQVGLSPWAAPEDAGAIDALEIVPIDGPAFLANACTQADMDATCGPDADCQYGHCVPGFAVWGPLPPEAHRRDLVGRWQHLATHVQGDRHFAANAVALANAAPTLVAAPGGTRAFHAGLHAIVNGMRDHHTSFGGPGTGGAFYPMAGGGSSTVGGCFGPGMHDLLAPAGSAVDLGYVVYRAAPSAFTGAPLRKGDALTAIDGRKPLDWVRDVWIAHASGAPSDPSADLGWSSTELAGLIAKRASTIEITRCDSDVRCDGGHRQVLSIDVAGPAYASLLSTGGVNVQGGVGCSIRFQNAIEKFAPSQRGDNTVSGQVVRGDVLAITFDGTLDANNGQWTPSMQALFAGAPPTKVLFDTRQGYGGYTSNSAVLTELIRPSSNRIGYVDLAVADWQGGFDFAKLAPTYAACAGQFTSYLCFLTDSWFNAEPAPIAGNARVAFLNTANVSANDYLARMVQGRPNQRVFSPGNTSGAFGTISSMPSMLVGWYGGSIQMEDSRWGATLDEIAGQPWQSGTGIAPDVVIAERMSDAIDDRDTMLEAAHAWLAGAP
jgi:hypothetical protein